MPMATGKVWVLYHKVHAFTLVDLASGWDIEEIGAEEPMPYGKGMPVAHRCVESLAAHVPLFREAWSPPKTSQP